MCLNRPLGTLGSPGLSGHRSRAHAARVMLRRPRWAQQRVDRWSSLQGAMRFYLSAHTLDKLCAILG